MNLAYKPVTSVPRLVACSEFSAVFAQPALGWATCCCSSTVSLGDQRQAGRSCLPCWL